jgi:putative membrane protein
MAGDTRNREVTTDGAGVRAWLVVYLKGFAMGSADAFPGVSGGTIAFIVGIYERLVRAIAELDPRVVAHLTDLHRPEGRRRLWADIQSMDVPFLAVLGTGAVSALVLVSRAAHAALTTIPAITFGFFFGLIAASAVVFADQLELDSPGRIGAALSGFVLAFLVSGVSTGSEISHALPLIFFAGMIAISATILPGVSGAFFLLLFGQYEYLSGVLKTFVDRSIGLLTGEASLSAVIEPATVVVVFGCGAVIGLLSLARIIREALDRYRVATLTFLVALMVGALRLPVERILEETTTLTPTTVVPIVLAAVVGGVAVLLLDRYSAPMSY